MRYDTYCNHLLAEFYFLKLNNYYYENYCISSMFCVTNINRPFLEENWRYIMHNYRVIGYASHVVHCAIAAHALADWTNLIGGRFEKGPMFEHLW